MENDRPPQVTPPTSASASESVKRPVSRSGAEVCSGDRDPSCALVAQVEAPAGAEPPRVVRTGVLLPRPVPHGSFVRQSFSHGRSKTVVVEKIKRRLLPRSEEPRLPAPGGAQCGGGEKAEPALTEPLATSRAHGVPIAPAPNALPSGDAGRARVRAGPETTRLKSKIPLPADSRGLLTEGAVATRLSLSPATLRNWRVKGLGPPFVRLSLRAVRYQAEVVDEWIATLARRSTSDKGRENG